MTRTNRFLTVLLVILACLGFDQCTKWLAKTYLPKHDVISMAGDTVRIQYVENRGAFLSLGASLPDKWRAVIFTGAVAVLLAALTIYLLFFASLGRTKLAAFSLICGGGLSNLYDRIAYDGYVIDFLNLGIGPLRTGIFNGADTTIVVGTLLLFFSARNSDRGSASRSRWKA
jgi:signal peptidase II